MVIAPSPSMPSLPSFLPVVYSSSSSASIFALRTFSAAPSHSSAALFSLPPCLHPSTHIHPVYFHPLPFLVTCFYLEPSAARSIERLHSSLKDDDCSARSKQVREVPLCSHHLRLRQVSSINTTPRDRRPKYVGSDLWRRGNTKEERERGCRGRVRLGGPGAQERAS